MNVLVINYPTLRIGGIENFLIDLMKYSVSNEYRIIWVYKNPMTFSKTYNDTLNKIISIDRKSFFYTYSLDCMNIVKEDKIICLSFTPFDHNRILKFANKYKDYNINPIYIIANTKGRFYYIEEYFFGKLRSLLKYKLKQIMSDWIKNQQIYFFSELQLEAFEKNYDLDLEYKELSLVPDIFPLVGLDNSIIREKFKQKEFNIVTITRFDFPHKNYLLGLVDAFAELRKKHENIRLHIIGYGQDENIVIRKINNLPENIRASILMYGALSMNQIKMVLENMHLNISVAGSVGVGATNGVLSIPARNFCENMCEVYGFLPNSISKTTSTEPGEPVIPYIEKVINMSVTDYNNIVIDGYKAYCDRPVNPDFLFNLNTKLNKRYNTNNLIFEIMDIFKDISFKLYSYIK